MTMKLVLSAILFFSLLLCGCSSKPHTVVGTWNVENPGAPGNSTTYTFRKDGTYSFVEHAVFQSIHSHQTATGNYQYTSKILTIYTTHENMGIDPSAMAAIDALERQLNPHHHIPQDKADVPVKIEQPTTSFTVEFDGDKIKLKDLTNFSDHGVTYVRADTA